MAKANRNLSILVVTVMLLSIVGFGQTPVIPNVETTKQVETGPLESQWKGKTVAYLGDSMTQKPRNGDGVYWEYLSEWLGIVPYVYGISGHQWDNIYNQAVKLYDERGTAIDAILIFAGTNDYNHSVPLGKFFDETIKETTHNGKLVDRKYRTPILNDTTFCGRINKAMTYLKEHFPRQQIVIMTPLHRGFAKFSETNVQPEELFANGQGLYLDDYVNMLRQAASHWAVPLIDLYALSGLYPLSDAHAPYFRHTETDRLHLNTAGNLRLAKAIQYQLLGLPSTFIDKD